MKTVTFLLNHGSLGLPSFLILNQVKFTFLVNLYAVFVTTATRLILVYR